MKLTILAIGRARRGPEKALTDDYLARASAQGRGVGLGPASLIELEGRDQAAESAALLAKLPDGARLVALDERGESPSSRNFAATLGDWRDVGARDCCFAIGGADGHTDAIRRRADLLLSFGSLTLPHMLARVVLAEQIYRAATILSGHPYHRD